MLPVMEAFLNQDFNPKFYNQKYQLHNKQTWVTPLEKQTNTMGVSHYHNHCPRICHEWRTTFSQQMNLSNLFHSITIPPWKNKWRTLDLTDEGIIFFINCIFFFSLKGRQGRGGSNTVCICLGWNPDKPAHLQRADCSSIIQYSAKILLLIRRQIRVKINEQNLTFVLTQNGLQFHGQIIFISLINYHSLIYLCFYDYNYYLHFPISRFSIFQTINTEIWGLGFFGIPTMIFVLVSVFMMWFIQSFVHVRGLTLWQVWSCYKLTTG